MMTGSLPKKEREARLSRAFRYLFGEYEKWLKRKDLKAKSGLTQRLIIPLDGTGLQEGCPRNKNKKAN